MVVRASRDSHLSEIFAWCEAEKESIRKKSGSHPQNNIVVFSMKITPLSERIIIIIPQDNELFYGGGKEQEDTMYIVMITGSPHRHGTSALLADEFIRGATESGHAVFRFDAAFECVHPCIGCDTCRCGKSHVCFKTV